MRDINKEAKEKYKERTEKKILDELMTELAKMTVKAEILFAKMDKEGRRHIKKHEKEIKAQTKGFFESSYK